MASSLGDGPDGQHRRRDDDGRQQRVEGEPALVEPRTGLRGVDPDEHDDREGGGAEGRHGDAHRAGSGQAGGDARVEQDRGEDAAHQELAGPRVGAEIDAVVAEAPEQGERQRAERQCGQHDGEQRAVLAADRLQPVAALVIAGTVGERADAEEPGDQQREHQVELLFDGQAPEVEQGRRRCEQIGIALLGEDEPPVGHVGERGDDVAGQVLALHGVGHEHPEHQGEGETGQRGRHEAAEAAAPEGPEVDAVAAGLLGQQQGGDEEARQREEGRDAEVAADHPAEPAVEEQDARDGHAAQAVERGEVGEAGRIGSGVRRRRGVGRRRAGWRFDVGYGHTSPGIISTVGPSCAFGSSLTLRPPTFASSGQGAGADEIAGGTPGR